MELAHRHQDRHRHRAGTYPRRSAKSLTCGAHDLCRRARRTELVAAGHRRRHCVPALASAPAQGRPGRLPARRTDDGCRRPGRALGARALRGRLLLDRVPARALLRRRPRLAPAAVRAAGTGRDRGRRARRATTCWSMAHVRRPRPADRRAAASTRRGSRTASAAGTACCCNGVLAFALDARGPGACACRARTARCATPIRKRNPEPELFERIYDRDVQRLLPGRAPTGDWWLIDVAAARDRVARAPRPSNAGASRGKIVCLCHDIERGLGHLGPRRGARRRGRRDAARSRGGDARGRGRAGVRATYSVVGLVSSRRCARSRAGGHCPRLPLVRPPDRRRPPARPLPRGRLPAEGLPAAAAPATRRSSADERLLLHNFEWIATVAPPARYGRARAPPGAGAGTGRSSTTSRSTSEACATSGGPRARSG